MKRCMLAEGAVLMTALLFSIMGCTQNETRDEPSLPVFAPVETAETENRPDPLALTVPHDTVRYDVPPLPAAQTASLFGTLSDAARRIGFYTDGTLREETTVNGSTLYYLLRSDGVRISDTPYLAVSAVTDTVFAVTADRATVNRVGLVSADGAVLIPCEAAAVLPLTGGADALQPTRFVEVIFAEDRAENAGDAFFMNGETGTMYTGYALIYDLALRRYVPSVRLSGNAARQPDVSSDRIAVRDVSTGAVALYTPDGTAAVTYSHLDEFVLCRDSYLVVSDGEYRIMEYDTTATYVSFEPLTPVTGEGRYYAMQTDGGKTVIDRFGNRLFNETFTDITEEYGGIIHAVTADGTHVLTDLSGQHLYESADTAPHHLARGIYECGSTVILPDGSQSETASGDGAHLLFLDEAANACCFSDHAFTLSLPSDEYLPVGEALIAVRDGNEYVLYDLYAGEEIVRGGYGMIAAAYGRIYARNGDTVDVFNLNTVIMTDDSQSLQNVNINQVERS